MWRLEPRVEWNLEVGRAGNAHRKAVSAGSWLHSCLAVAVALSSTEAEYVAAGEAVKEALWYRSWIFEVFQAYICAKIHCDNTSAIKLSLNASYHDKSKHIGLRHHFIRDEISKGHVDIQWVATEKQQADILTKPVDRYIFERLRDKLMIRQ